MHHEARAEFWWRLRVLFRWTVIITAVVAVAVFRVDQELAIWSGVISAASAYLTSWTGTRYANAYQSGQTVNFVSGFHSMRKGPSARARARVVDKNR